MWLWLEALWRLTYIRNSSRLFPLLWTAQKSMENQSAWSVGVPASLQFFHRLPKKNRYGGAFTRHELWWPKPWNEGTKRRAEKQLVKAVFVIETEDPFPPLQQAAYKKQDQCSRHLHIALLFQIHFNIIFPSNPYFPILRVWLKIISLKIFIFV